MPKILRKIDEVSMPEAIVGKHLWDEDGRCWLVGLEERKGWFFKSQRLNFNDTVIDFRKPITDCLSETLEAVLKTWLKESVDVAIEKLAKDLGPVYDPCIQAGQKSFRKQLITKLGEVGKTFWRKILEHQFYEIGRLYNEIDQQTNDQRAVMQSGLLPPNCRSLWRVTQKGQTYELFCFEFPPERRTIKIFGETRRLAFPWLRAFAGFVGKETMYFWLFYGRGPIKGLDAKLFFPNLPNIFNSSPYYWCLGRGHPVFDSKDPDWYQHLFSWFWDSEFGEANGGVLGYWLQAKERISEVSSLDAWEKLSKKEPEKMLTLAWEEMDQSLGAFADDALRHMIAKKEEKDNKQASQTQLTNQAIAKLIEQFGNQLQEELHFLGCHFSIPAEIEDEAKSFANARAKEAVKTIQASLADRFGQVADKVVDLYKRRRKE